MADKGYVDKKKGYTESEKYTGVWLGQDVRFTRTLGMYRFSDEECERLCNDEIIYLDLDGKYGPYTIYGKLAHQIYKGYPFVGFQKLGSIAAGQRLDDEITDEPIPEVWRGHRFSEVERTTLLNGGMVYADDLWSDGKQKIYAANIIYAKQPNGFKKLDLILDKQGPSDRLGFNLNIKRQIKRKK